jgi:beta-aspartyl-peptidase (threonine type)
MEYGGLNLKDAAEKVVLDILVKDGGEGGVISIDAQGNVSMPYNSEGMYRGEIDAAGAFRVSIFGDN